jgi:spermidine/putrescine transport system substrate-binding protein
MTRDHRLDETDEPRAFEAARVTRRAALTRAAGGALAASSLGSLLAACGSSSSGGSTTAAGTSSSSSKTGVGGIPIATKTSPGTLPIYSDNRPIASGRKPEKGPLVVFDWGTYLSPAVVKSFQEKYGVSVQLTTYSSTNEAVKKLTSGAIAADLWVPVVEQLPNYVAAKLIRPINHSYIPNLNNVLPSFQSPWYDAGARYTVPNYFWTTGIAWRNDLIKIDPSTMSNPWEVFWTAAGANGKLGLQNAAPFDSLSLGLLKQGIYDFSSVTQAQVTNVLNDLQQLVKKGAKLQYTSFQPLGTGTEVLAQAWNGDVLLVPNYLPKGTSLKAISYWFPPDGRGSVNSDFWSIPKTSKNPVLAHLWMNHLLEAENAIANFRSVGYQQPLTTLTLPALKQAKVADPYILDMIWVTDIVAKNGFPNPIPTVQQNEWYESAYASLSSGS